MTNVNIEEITYEVVVEDDHEIINITLATIGGIQSINETGSGNSIIANTTASTVTLKTLAAGNSITLTDDGDTITVSATEDDLSNNTTDDLSEGSANFYFTEQRVADVMADFTGNIIPSANNVYTLGSETNVWRDVYIGPGSLYVDGQKIVSSDEGTINITTDPNQNLTIEAGADISVIPASGTVNVTATDINLGPETGGTIVEVNGSITVDDKFSISDTEITDGLIEFTGINQNAEIRTNGTGYVHLNTDAAYVGSLTGATKVSANTITTTAGDLNIGAASGTVTVEGFTNTLGMTTAIQTAKNEATAYTDTSIANLIDTAPATLDTLNELAAALGDDPNFATTVTNELALKLNASDFGSEFDTNLALKTTDDLAEGSNLYYTNNRVTSWLDGHSNRFSNDKAGGNLVIDMTLQDQIVVNAEQLFMGSFSQSVAISSNGEGNRIYGVGGALEVTGTVSDISNHNLTDLGDVSAPFGLNGGEIIVNMPGMGWVATPITTDNLGEGTTNLYYTDARVQSVIDAGGYLTEYTETDPIYTASSWYTTTNNSVNWDLAVSWGNHADQGYLTSIGDKSIFDLTDVSAPLGTGDGYILVWNDAANGFVATPITTDDLSEGSTNLYYTDDRARNAISLSTTNPAELSYNPATGVFSYVSPSTVANTNAVVLAVRNTTGASIAKGAPVYISGHSGGKTLVALAQNDTAGEYPAIGLVSGTIANNADGYVTVYGRLDGVNTSAYPVGTVLYLGATPGTLTGTRPTGSANAVQNIGKVSRQDANGTIIISGSGRANDVPNLDHLQVFIGNTSGYEKRQLTTSDILEGSNLFYTDGRADARIAASSVFAHADVVQIQPASDGQILVYNSAAGGFVNTPITTDDLAEGSTNLYFTDNRAVSAIEAQTELNFTNGITIDGNGNPTTINDLLILGNDNIVTPQTQLNFVVDAAGTPTNNLSVRQTEVSFLNDFNINNTVPGEFFVNTGSRGVSFYSPNGIQKFESGQQVQFRADETSFRFADNTEWANANLGLNKLALNIPLQVDTISSNAGVLTIQNGVDLYGPLTVAGQPFTTSYLPEGSNLYFTDQRAIDAVENTAQLSLNRLRIAEVDTTIPGGGAWNNAALQVSGDTYGAPAFFVRNIDTTQYEPSPWGSNIYANRFDTDLTGANLDGHSLIVGHQIGDRNALHNAFSYALTLRNTTVANGDFDAFNGELNFVVYDKASGQSSVGSTTLQMTTSDATFNVPVNIDTIVSPSGTLNINNGVNVNGPLSVGGQALTTDFIPEGSSNLYFTDQRADDRISAASILDLNDVMQIQPIADGQILAYSDLAGGMFVNVVPTIDNLADVDTSTTAPNTDDILVWDGSNWVPSDVLVGIQSAIDAILGA